MGYDLHITKREHWAEDEDLNKISFDEWLTYVELDQELKLVNGYQIRIPGIENTIQNVPGFCKWSGHSSMQGESMPWFDYRDGCISTKNPDEETIKKMLAMAEKLNAKVQGDDGEIYNETYFDDQQKFAKQMKYKVTKPWWKFWK